MLTCETVTNLLSNIAGIDYHMIFYIFTGAGIGAISGAFVVIVASLVACVLGAIVIKRRNSKLGLGGDGFA